MKIESPRFGTLEVEDSRVIEFPRGLVGFEDCKRFSLFHPEGEGQQPSYFILQSLDDPALAFHIADPAQFGFGHEIILSDEEAADLALGEAERNVANAAAPLVVMVMLSKESASQPVRANLTGPLVINLDTRRGLQHVFARLDFKIGKSEQEKP
jgi:flagellar assembly factor FliW